MSLMLHEMLVKGVNTISTPTAMTNAIIDNLYADGIWVAVGSATLAAGPGVIWTSYDGVNWTSRTNPSAQSLRGVTYSPSLDRWVTVGENGMCMTSNDGITWTSGSMGAAVIWQDVTWVPFLNLFIAVGQNGNLRTSPDGINWTARTSGVVAPDYIHGINHNGTDTVMFCGWAGVIRTSTNGSTWTARTSGSTAGFRQVKYLNGIWISVSGTDNTIIRSTTSTGTTWTSTNAGGATSGMRGVAFGNGVWVAAGLNGFITRSTNNGLTWTPQTSNTTNSFYDVEYDSTNGLFVAMGDNITKISTDGVTWL